MSRNWAEIVDDTWPAAKFFSVGPFRLRSGQGAGSRVSAASALGPVIAADIDAAEAAMLDMGQKRLFCLRPGDDALDAALAGRGYRVLDPVNIYECPVDNLTDKAVPMATAFQVREPLEIMREIWASGGIGPERLAVMARAQGPKTGFLMRNLDQPGGVFFVAKSGDVAMVHALEILPHHRRLGLGRWAMRAAAFWARDNGASVLSVICTKANQGANGLYRALGMEIVGEYHYRLLD